MQHMDYTNNNSNHQSQEGGERHTHIDNDGKQQQVVAGGSPPSSSSSRNSSSSSFIPPMATLCLDGGDKPISPSELDNVFGSDDGKDEEATLSSCSYSSSYYESLLSGPIQEEQAFVAEGSGGGDHNILNRRQVGDVDANSPFLGNVASRITANNVTLDQVMSSSSTRNITPTTTLSSTARTTSPSAFVAAAGSSNNEFEGSHLKKWFARYAELQQYQKEHGHCSVPNDYEPNKQLGRWVKRQRHQHYLYSEGKHSTMTQERKQLLESIGFIWDSRNDTWEHHFQELIDFKKTHGHCKVPSKYSEKPSLGLWVKRQRGDYKSYCDRLVAKQPSKNDTIVNEKRFQRLLNIGFAFDHRATKSTSSSTAAASI